MTRFPIDPLSVTAAWLSEVLRADVRECHLEQIGIGVGLLGRLYRAHLDGGPDGPRSVVVKLPILQAEARSALCEDLEFYLREVRFYQEIGLANPLPPARPYFAAFDEATHDFVLVLEDLGRLRIADQVAGCTATDAETVIDAIARHHAHWWQSDRLAALPWLKTFSTPPFTAALAGNFEVAWPRVLEGVGAYWPESFRKIARMSSPIFFVTPGYGERQRQNFHYSQAVRHGNRVETSGQGGWDDNWCYPESVRDEVIQAFDNVERTLATAGASWRHVVSVHSYHLPNADGTIGQDHLATMAEQFRRRMGERAPLWTCIGVAALAGPRMRVEIQVTAVIDDDG